MNKKLTDITVLLDKSGSMGPLQEDTIGGFNKFIEGQAKVDGDANLSLIMFDDQYSPLLAYEPIRMVKALDDQSYVPRGSTALLDALCRSIDETGERLRAIPEKDRPGKVLFLIMTDGEENSSIRFKRADVQKRIEHQTRVYGWQFVYIGANQDSFREAQSIGIYNPFYVINYVASPAGTEQVFNSMSGSVSSFRMATNNSDIFFTKDDQDKQTALGATK